MLVASLGGSCIRVCWWWWCNTSEMSAKFVDGFQSNIQHQWLTLGYTITQHEITIVFLKPQPQQWKSRFTSESKHIDIVVPRRRRQISLAAQCCQYVCFSFWIYFRFGFYSLFVSKHIMTFKSILIGLLLILFSGWLIIVQLNRRWNWFYWLGVEECAHKGRLQD